MDPFSPPSSRAAFSPPPPSATEDAFSPPPAVGQMDTFSPPPPDPSSPPVVRRKPRARAPRARLRSAPVQEVGREVRDDELFVSRSRRTNASTIGHEVGDNQLLVPSRRTNARAGDTRRFVSSPPSVGREVYDDELFSPRAVGREVRDDELFSTRSVGREVRDDELFSARATAPRCRNPSSPPPCLGREVRDTELYRRPRQRSSSSSIGQIGRIGREVRDDELYSAREARSDLAKRIMESNDRAYQEKAASQRGHAQLPRRRVSLPDAHPQAQSGRSSTSTRRPPPLRSRPKRPRVVDDYKRNRARLEEATGEKVTQRDATLYAERFAELPWRIGRDRDQCKSTLAELCLERLKTTVRFGRIEKEKDLSELPDDFAYELFTDEKVKLTRLQEIERHHPVLAHSVEAAFAERLTAYNTHNNFNHSKKLPDGVESWRELFENEQEMENEKLNNARKNLKSNYSESKSDAAVKRVTTVARNSGASMSSKRRRSGSTEQVSTINRLKDLHRRDRKRRR